MEGIPSTKSKKQEVEYNLTNERNHSMSYGIYLQRQDSTRQINQISWKDMPYGGTYSIGNGYVEEDDLYLNITYNFAWYFYKTIDGDLGIRWIYGKKASEVVDALRRAREECLSMAAMEEVYGKILSETWGKGEEYNPEKVANNYWYPCAAHAAKALEGLIKLAEIASDFTFNGD